MGHHAQKRRRPNTKSQTLPSSPTHSSSSSDFEFTICISPRKSSAALCPADELFYKGQLLPLHLSPRLSMVRNLLLSSTSTSTSSSDTTTTNSHSSTDSSRNSSVTDDEFKRLTNNSGVHSVAHHPRKPSKYFSLPKFSSVFRKEQKNATPASSGGAVKRVSSSAKEVIRKYLKKVKPLYEKLSQRQHQPQHKISRPPPPTLPRLMKDQESDHPKENRNTRISHSFSGNLRYPRGIRSCISSCPSSMGSSPSHARNGFGYGFTQTGRVGAGTCNPDSSSMDELQNAIQGAIAHCKNSMLQNKAMISNEI